MLSIACLLRGLPLFVSASPRTPLRALCVIALDTIHVLRHADPLSSRRRQEVSALLDFQACTNAVWDRKPLCAADYQALRAQLEQAGLGAWLTGYLGRLRELETHRPAIDRDGRCFDEVRAYRESVVRLSLATVAGVALNARCLDDALRATHDDDLAALCAMAMQCQIIDDVLDYRSDRAAGLPSFLTASRSRAEAIAVTADAVRTYGAARGRSGGAALLPLEAALLAVTAVTKLVVAAARFPR
jgi:hypothetical protein